jgi:hypothetical protein
MLYVWVVFLRGDLLYFSGGVEGRVRLACRLLYPIFVAGRGLLYFCDYFLIIFFNLKYYGKGTIDCGN